MKKTMLTLILISVSAVFFAGSTASAQNATSNNDLKIGGELWMGIHGNLTKDHGNATDLQLDKVQLDVDKKVNELFTAAVKIEKSGTAHVNDYYVDQNGERVYTGGVGLGLYLKEATIKMTPINGPLSVYGIAGIPETPTGQFIENLKGDYMFNIDETEFTERYTDEKKYDAAVGFGFKYEKLVDAYFTIAHGDGYKNLGGKNAPDYKYAYNGRITVSPLEALKISGFFTVDNHKPQDEWIELHEDDILEGAFSDTTNTQISSIKAGMTGVLGASWSNPDGNASTADEGDFNLDGNANNQDYVDALNYLASVNSTFAGYKQSVIEGFVDGTDVKGGFYGGGIAWADSSIRAGFNYFYLRQKIAGEKSEVDGDQVFDFWANVNLNQFTGLPFAIYTGYSYMKDKNTKINGVSVEAEGKAVDTTEWFVGAGYEFSGEAGMYIFYRQYDEDISGFDAEKNVKFVGTLKF